MIQLSEEEKKNELNEHVDEDTPLQQKPDSMPDEENKREYSDLLAFIILGFLYFVQGMPMGFFKSSITLILTEKGASFTELSKLSLIAYPYAFKIFFAPIQDSIYFPRFGKRKTYIIPALIICGVLTIAVSPSLEGLLNQMEVNTLVIIGIVIYFVMAMQDIAVDGWVVSLISKKNLTLAGAFQKIMLIVGTFVGYNMFVPLNSVDFCNKHIFSEPRDTPLITIFGFCLFSGILSVLVALGLLFFKEKPPKQENIVTLREVILLFGKFATNQFLRLFVLVLLFANLNSAPVSAIFEPIVIQKVLAYSVFTMLNSQGYKKEDRVNISTVLLPVRFIALSIAAYVNKLKRRELKIYTGAYFLITLSNILPLWIINNFEGLTYAQLTALFIAEEAISGTISGFQDASWLSFVLNITHESTASTFTTSIYSMLNFSNMWPTSLALALQQVMASNVIMGFSIVFGLLFMIILLKYYISLQSRKAEDFGFHREMVDRPGLIEETVENFEESRLKHDILTHS